MVLACVCNRIKSILLSLLGIFRRALCCVSRKRSYSHDGEDEVLTGVNVQSYSPKKTNHVDRDWNSWDETPRTVEEHIEKYREKLVQPRVAADEPEPDYFGDMEPTKIQQAKYFVASGAAADEQEQDFKRLKATVQADIPISNELEDWDENNQGAAGWEEINNENTKQMIRENRKELRSQRQRERREPHSSFLQAERLTSDR